MDALARADEKPGRRDGYKRHEESVLDQVLPAIFFEKGFYERHGSMLRDVARNSKISLGEYRTVHVL